MFLAVERKTVIDVAFQPEIPEIPEVVEVIEDLAATPPVFGVAPVAAVAAVPEVVEVTHEEVRSMYVEDSAEQVVRNLENSSLTIDFYDIKLNSSLKPTLKTVRERGRTVAPARQTVEIENVDGDLLGSAEV